MDEPVAETQEPVWLETFDSQHTPAGCIAWAFAPTILITIGFYINFFAQERGDPLFHVTIFGIALLQVLFFLILYLPWRNLKIMVNETTIARTNLLGRIAATIEFADIMRATSDVDRDGVAWYEISDGKNVICWGSGILSNRTLVEWVKKRAPIPIDFPIPKASLESGFGSD